MRKEASFYLFLLVMLAFGIQAKAANTVQVGEIGGWSQKVVMSLSSSHFETIYPLIYLVALVVRAKSANCHSLTIKAVEARIMVATLVM